MAVLALLTSTAASAAVPPTPTKNQLLSTLLVLRGEHPGSDFAPIRDEVERRYGPRARAALRAILGDARIDDRLRYIALMSLLPLLETGAARAVLAPALRDPSWMIRAGALGVIRDGFGDRKLAPAVEGVLFSDPALVVRSAALDSLVALDPKLAEDAAFRALLEPMHYHRGRAQVVPAKALQILADLVARDAVAHEPGRIARDLKALAPRVPDARLRREVLSLGAKLSRG